MDRGLKESARAGTVLWQRVMLFVFPMVTEGCVSSALSGLLLPISGYSYA